MTTSAEIAAQIAGYTSPRTLLRRFDDAARAEGAPRALPAAALVALLGNDETSRLVYTYVPRGLSRADAKRLAIAAAYKRQDDIVATVLVDVACNGAGAEELSRLASEAVDLMHCHQHVGMVARRLLWTVCADPCPRAARRVLASVAAELFVAYPQYRWQKPGLADTVAIAALLGEAAAGRVDETASAQDDTRPPGVVAAAIAASGGPAAARRALARAGGACAPLPLRRFNDCIEWGFDCEVGPRESRSEAEYIRRRHRASARNLAAFARWRAAVAAAGAGVEGAVPYARRC